MKLLAVLVLSLAACGGPEDEVAKASGASGKADMPSAATLSCGSWAKGAFTGYSSTGLHEIRGTRGVAYTLTFNGQYPPSWGASIAVHDGETGALVAQESASWTNQRTLTFTAGQDAAYLVLVYPDQGWASGGYTLDLSCVITNLPDCSPTPPEQACASSCPGGYYIASWGVSCGCCEP